MNSDKTTEAMYNPSHREQTYLRDFTDWKHERQESLVRQHFFGRKTQAWAYLMGLNLTCSINVSLGRFFDEEDKYEKMKAAVELIRETSVDELVDDHLQDHLIETTIIS